MSTIPPKYRSNPYRGKHPYSNLWTDLSTYPPIPGATQSLTTPTATPRPLTEPFAHWLPTAPPPSYSHATRNDVEAPGSSTGRKTFVFWASMVAIILAFCWLIYKHIRGAKDGERPPDHDDPQPRAPTPAPQENRQRNLASSGSTRRGATRGALGNARESIDWRGRGRRGRGRRSVDIGEVQQGPRRLSPIAEEGSSLDNPSDADDEGGPDS